MKRPEDEKDRLVEAALDALQPDGDGQGIVAPLDELSERRITERILNRFRFEMSAPRKARRPYRWIATAVVAVGCIGAVYGVLVQETPEKTPRAAPVAAVTQAAEAPDSQTKRKLIPGSRFALLYGEVFSDRGSLTPGSEIPSAERIRTGEGQAALTLPTGIAAGLAENTSVRVLWHGDDQYGVSLFSGMALFSVDSKQKRDSFFIDTPAGTMHVKGTLFTVVVSPNDGVFAKLHHGVLEVEKPNGSVQGLPVGELVNLTGEQPVKEPVKEHVLSQLQAFRCMDRGELFTELSHFKCLGAKDPRVNSASGHYATNGVKTAKPLSIRELMRLARRQKTNGDWSGAASSYQDIIRQYPRSDEARTSMVSLAQIQLNHLGNAAAALKQFSRYLKHPGPLAREAMFGKAEAFRALGKRSREKKALVDFLSSFPKGLLANAVSKRLKQLQDH